MNNEAMIWTTRGNVLECELDYTHGWEDETEYTLTLTFENNLPVPHIEKKGSMTFWERYYFKDNGELAKESRHVKLFQGLPFAGEQGQIG